MIKDEGLYFCAECESETWSESTADLIRCPECLCWTAEAVLVS